MRSDDWDSGLEVYTSIPVTVDEEVLNILRKLDRKFPDVEFSVLFKAKLDGGEYIVYPEYYIPAQEVSHGSVEYLEDLSVLRKEGFIAIVHKHPSGLKDFSSVDFEYINKHFPVSLLWVDGELEKGTAHIHSNGKIFVLPAEIYILTKEIEGIEKIRRRPVQKFYTYKGRADLDEEAAKLIKDLTGEDWDELEKYNYYY